MASLFGIAPAVFSAMARKDRRSMQCEIYAGGRGGVRRQPRSRCGRASRPSGGLPSPCNPAARPARRRPPVRHQKRPKAFATLKPTASNTTAPAVIFSCVHIPVFALHAAFAHIRDISAHPHSRNVDNYQDDEELLGAEANHARSTSCSPSHRSVATTAKRTLVYGTPEMRGGASVSMPGSTPSPPSSALIDPRRLGSGFGR